MIAPVVGLRTIFRSALQRLAGPHLAPHLPTASIARRDMRRCRIPRPTKEPLYQYKPSIPAIVSRAAGFTSLHLIGAQIHADHSQVVADIEHMAIIRKQ